VVVTLSPVALLLLLLLLPLLLLLLLLLLTLIINESVILDHQSLSHTARRAREASRHRNAATLRDRRQRPLSGRPRCTRLHISQSFATLRKPVSDYFRHFDRSLISLTFPRLRLFLLTRFVASLFPRIPCRADVARASRRAFIDNRNSRADFTPRQGRVGSPTRLWTDTVDQNDGAATDVRCRGGTRSAILLAN